MPKRKKRSKKRKTTKKQKQDMSWVITGLILLLLAIFSCLRFGIFSRQLINCFRFIVGDSHYLASLLTGIFGLVMIIYNQPPHLGIKKTTGLILSYCGLALWQSSTYFSDMMINHGFIDSFLTTISAEFSRGQNTNAIGGGIIGTSLYQITFPIFSNIGTRFLAIIAIIIGLAMIVNIKFKDVVEKFQKFSQLFIEKNKDAGDALKTKYTDLVEKHTQKVASNREKLTDPLSRNEDPFPNTDDFNASNAKTQPDNQTEFSNATPTEDDDQAQYSAIPIQESAPVADDSLTTESTNQISNVEVTHSKTSDDLPKSHSFTEDDNKIRQELSGVDHGDFDTKVANSTKNEHYVKPPMSLLAPIKSVDQSQDRQLIQKNTQVLESTFNSFGVKVNVKKAVLGPTVTRYEVQPAVGVKVSRIVNLADDLALALAAKDIRIEAPIPGKPLIGIEVPNKTTSAVSFKDVMLHQDNKSKHEDLAVPLGKDVTGTTISADLRKMPHLLIAGSTGSGKSVAINTIITSILMKSDPQEVKLVLIDPKMVELSVYNGVPHLLIPVVTDAKLAANALRKTVKEMERRYKLFAASGVRNITEFNQKVAENNADKSKPVMEKLPYVVVIVDELSDLMMVAGHDVEDAIVRLAQMARAAGIHMILATQRPSVDVITGLIKANVPSRISFAVSSGVDSRTILDQVGAEKLLGRGDMLFLPIGAAKPERIQGAYISVDEVEKIVSWVKDQQEAEYNEDMIPSAKDTTATDSASDEPEDEFYNEAVSLVRKQQSASVSMLQRRFRIGYNRAARIVDEMEAKGIVGPSEGSKPRQVLVPPEKQGDNNG
ncbi:DNA translocase FtsK [Lactobacillus hominis]|uniref:DNA translocase FtsK n=1 Tax=Lactobacillus hominis DSM 23910 = CRBIP 24.179 TaxID=1423758 RepID=I7IVM7_9LACO|nr:DNA translocase FtsK [Lactobacillus hominis]KRM84449.1 DNA segregation ATPase FtsK SpoIIIE related protein [Lactobacillus hominis DSM 23910 = CRBIP 24.179]MCT3347942.1 DNA translocase FtsK [Lactobacillus hominis]CCI81713.1 FtsK/SpoIIIE family cell division protein [Lactobacillus hominis DSM 23910 = CRBIP 24.179]